MIRKLTLADNQQVMNLLLEEKEFNLFIIGDIENFGYGEEFQELWGEFDQENQLKAILLRYYGNYIPYAKEEFDVLGFAKIIQEDSKWEMISGKQELLNMFNPYLTFSKQKELYFSHLIDAAMLPKDLNRDNLQQATIEDVEQLSLLLEGIEEFQFNQTSQASFRRKLETKTGRTYFIKEDGRIVSTASTTAENSLSAMVVAVATHPDYRERGYASLCMQTLCHDLLEEGKSLCIFYDNPKAASIYRRIGFEEIGRWSMLYR